MACEQLFQSLVDFASQNPQHNLIEAWFTSNRTEDNRFVRFFTCTFNLDEGKLVSTSAETYFSDRFAEINGRSQPFDASQTDTIHEVQIILPGGPLQILNADGSLFAQYSLFECSRDDGILVCYSDIIREAFLVTFRGLTINIP